MTEPTTSNIKRIFELLKDSPEVYSDPPPASTPLPREGTLETIDPEEKVYVKVSEMRSRQLRAGYQSEERRRNCISSPAVRHMQKKIQHKGKGGRGCR